MLSAMDVSEFLSLTAWTPRPIQFRVKHYCRVEETAWPAASRGTDLCTPLQEQGEQEAAGVMLPSWGQKLEG